MNRRHLKKRKRREKRRRRRKEEKRRRGAVEFGVELTTHSPVGVRRKQEPRSPGHRLQSGVSREESAPAAHGAKGSCELEHSWEGKERRAGRRGCALHRHRLTARRSSFLEGSTLSSKETQHGDLTHFQIRWPLTRMRPQHFVPLDSSGSGKSSWETLNMILPARGPFTPMQPAAFTGCRQADPLIGFKRSWQIPVLL